MKENQIEHLRKFHKKTFNFEAIIETARELKYLGLFKNTIKSEYEITSLEDIYKYVAHLLATCDLYDNDGFAKAVKSESGGDVGLNSAGL